MLRAVVYDLDGTLVDSRQDLASSVNAMLARMGLPRHEDKVIWGFVGEGAERLIRRSLGPAHEDRYPEAAPLWREEYGRRLLDTTRDYPGIAQLLRQPPERRAVLTNKPGSFARTIVAGLGLSDAFRAASNPGDLLVLGGDEAPRKPAPDGLLRLLGLLAVRPDEALLVGDSTVDLATGRAAGVPVCAVTWGLGQRAALTSADYVCDAPEEVAALLRRLQVR